MIFIRRVALIIYNRLDTTKQVLSSIRRAAPKKLYLISDAAKTGDTINEKKVEEVRRYVEEHIDWDCQVYKNYAGENLGCKMRPLTGIDWVFEQEEKAIILEDDILPDDSFYRFCQEMLEYYEEDERIMIIGGYKRDVGYQAKHDYMFSYHCSTWDVSNLEKSMEM